MLSLALCALGLITDSRRARRSKLAFIPLSISPLVIIRSRSLSETLIAIASRIR